MEITLLSEDEIRECVKLNEIAIEAVPQGLTNLADGRQ